MQATRSLGRAAVVALPRSRVSASHALCVHRRLASVALVRRRGGDVLAHWRGAVARELLGAPLLARLAPSDGEHPCTAHCANRVVLAAASIEAALDAMRRRRDAILDGAEPADAPTVDGAPSEPLPRRIARVGATLASTELFVARVLFAYPGRHFTAQDVTCLAALSAPADIVSGVEQALAGLVSSDVVQRIEISGSPAFYDIDTRPHAHRYDPATGELHDAE